MKSPETPSQPNPMQEHEAPAVAAQASSAGPLARRAYRSPRLVSYGRLTEVTQFGGSQVLDSGTSGSLGQSTTG